MSMAPLYLSVFCTLYFQILLVNDISPVKKWPKWIMILGTLLFTFVPASFVLFIPPRIAGLQAYCSYSESIDTRTYVFKWLVSHLWIVLAGLIGIVSITTILVYIVRKCKDADIQTRGSSGSLDTLCTSDSSRRRTSSAIIVRTLLSIVWFPVMPIISLWFNVSYSTVRYKTQRSNTPMDALNIVFQFLQVPVMAMTFYASPCVKRAFKTYLSQGKSTKPAADDGIAIELPECSLHCYDIDNKARLYGARTPRIPSSTSSASTVRV
ncbi:hypothetical protein GGI12_002029 [Dipsacomyces acuminosporus]|nr:hypothetical protein GGI12_002029 [Dipsacomyces acuminosporus]